ncbi:hypothetical protein, partial [Exiguobacterium sp. s7]|uniref:hypothetical protein n=1 Tax=Exiguobacterium sp. s7 TaxID=2751235 RepID=UPI002036CB05
RMRCRNTKTQLAKFCTFRCIIVHICIAKYTKYQDGKKPAVSNKKDKLNQLREAYLQKKNEKKQAGEC